MERPCMGQQGQDVGISRVSLAHLPESHHTPHSPIITSDVLSQQSISAIDCCS